jgi:hypothetical protein
LRLAIAEQDGVLTARVEERGWLGHLTPAETRTLDQAIAGMYKLAGVDVVSEQAEAPAPAPESTAAAMEPVPAPASANGVAGGESTVGGFRRVPLTWAQWVDWWRRDRAGEPLPPPVPVLPAVANGAELTSQPPAGA